MIGVWLFLSTPQKLKQFAIKVLDENVRVPFMLFLTGAKHSNHDWLHQI